MNRQHALDDRIVKTIGIPVLGIFIPNLTSLITNRRYSLSELAACYLFFIVVSFLVWEGNVRLMYFIREKFPWTRRAYYKIIVALFFANVVYSGVLSFLLLRLWLICSREGPSEEHLLNTVLVIIIGACFITNIYEIVFLHQEKEYNESRVEQ